MRLLALLLVFLLGWLQYTFWVGKNGMTDYSSAKQDVEIQKQVNEDLKNRNDQIYAEISDLRKGSEAIEERARHELGLIKEGETFFRIIGDSKQD